MLQMRENSLELVSMLRVPYAQAPQTSHNSIRRGTMKKLINFETLITGKIIKALWGVFAAFALASIPVGLFGLFFSTSTCGSYEHEMGLHFCAPSIGEGIMGFFGVLFGAALAIVISRIVAEFFLVVFSMHDELKRIGKSDVEKTWGN